MPHPDIFGFSAKSRLEAPDAEERRGPRSARQRARTPGVPISFYRDAVESLRNGVVVITSGGVLAHMNRDAYRTLGVTANPHDIGRRYVNVLGDRPEILRVLRSAFELSNPPNRAELRLRHSGRAIGYTVCPVRNGRGEIVGATLLFKDLTQVEQLEERERLRDRLAALGEMAATFAHEVKNPLAGIKIMAGLLKRRAAGLPEAESLLNDIINEAKMADAIVVEILEFVRPIRLQVDAVALPPVLDAALRSARSGVNGGSTEVVFHVAPDLPPIQADPNQLRQLFTNLFTNAFEALEHEGRVVVEARLKLTEIDADPLEEATPPPLVVVSVSDDGPGVRDDVRDRIFSPFFTTKAKGSGLGLAIVRKIVDAHDGHIDLVAGETGGACFRVTVPVIAARELASPFSDEGLAQTGT